MLSRIQKHLARNTAFMAMLLIAFLFTACDNRMVSPEEIDAKMGGAVAQRNITGKDYYLGIYFGQGVVADTVPEIRDNYAISQRNFTAEELATINHQRDELVSIVQNYDPNFFKWFESAIESGDHLIVKDAMRRASAVTLFAFLQTEEGQTALGEASKPENIAKITEEINANGGIGEMTTDEVEDLLAQAGSMSSPESLQFNSAVALCLVLALVVLVVLALAVLIAVIIGVWLALFTWTWVWFARVGGAMTELQIERMIHSIATIYSGPQLQPAQPQFINP